MDNKQFLELFEDALATNLENQEELEERHLFKLFPDPEIGVAQGSALSALAGNIALREFDTRMNDRGIVCVRYIDDFILLGATEAKVRAAYHSARTTLREMGMDVYDLNDAMARKDGKVDEGNIYNGQISWVIEYPVPPDSHVPLLARNSWETRQSGERRKTRDEAGCERQLVLA